MYKFRYSKPVDLSTALRERRHDDDTTLLSGGMTLLPTMKQRLAAPSALIDLTGIPELNGIDLINENRIRIGACTSHSAVAQDPTVASFCAALGELAAGIGDPAVRHRGTIGGSLANNDPAADYPSAVLALNATIVTSDREIVADDFFKGLFETSLDEGEILTAVIFPRTKRAAYAKFPNPASRYAMVGIFVAEFETGEVRVAVTGAGSEGVFRWQDAEMALSKAWNEAAFLAASIDEGELLSDIHASAAYRASLMRAMGLKAVAASNA